MDHQYRPTVPREQRETPDLQSQLESLLDAVWASESDWRLDDRIDLALGIPPRRSPQENG